MQTARVQRTPPRDGTQPARGVVHIVERVGRFHRIIDCNSRPLVPVIERVFQALSVRDEEIRVARTRILSADKQTLSVGGFVIVRVIDPKLTAYAVDDPDATIKLVAASSLRASAATFTGAALKSSPELLGEAVRTRIHEALRQWGCQCTAFVPSNVRVSEGRIRKRRDTVNPTPIITAPTPTPDPNPTNPNPNNPINQTTPPPAAPHINRHSARHQGSLLAQHLLTDNAVRIGNSQPTAPTSPRSSQHAATNSFTASAGWLVPSSPISRQVPSPSASKQYSKLTTTQSSSPSGIPVRESVAVKRQRAIDNAMVAPSLGVLRNSAHNSPASVHSPPPPPPSPPRAPPSVAMKNKSVPSLRLNQSIAAEKYKTAQNTSAVELASERVHLGVAEPVQKEQLRVDIVELEKEKLMHPEIMNLGQAELVSPASLGIEKTEQIQPVIVDLLKEDKRLSGIVVPAREEKLQPAIVDLEKEAKPQPDIEDLEKEEQRQPDIAVPAKERQLQFDVGEVNRQTEIVVLDEKESVFYDTANPVKLGSKEVIQIEDTQADDEKQQEILPIQSASSSIEEEQIQHEASEEGSLLLHFAESVKVENPGLVLKSEGKSYFQSEIAKSREEEEDKEIVLPKLRSPVVEGPEEREERLQRLVQHQQVPSRVGQLQLEATQPVREQHLHPVVVQPEDEDEEQPQRGVVDYEKTKEADPVESLGKEHEEHVERSIKVPDDDEERMSHLEQLQLAIAGPEEEEERLSRRELVPNKLRRGREYHTRHQRRRNEIEEVSTPSSGEIEIEHVETAPATAKVILLEPEEDEERLAQLEQLQFGRNIMPVPEQAPRMFPPRRDERGEMDDDMDTDMVEADLESREERRQRRQRRRERKERRERKRLQIAMYHQQMREAEEAEARAQAEAEAAAEESDEWSDEDQTYQLRERRRSPYSSGQIGSDNESSPPASSFEQESRWVEPEYDERAMRREREHRDLSASTSATRERKRREREPTPHARTERGDGRSERGASRSRSSSRHREERRAEELRRASSGGRKRREPESIEEATPRSRSASSRISTRSRSRDSENWQSEAILPHPPHHHAEDNNVRRSRSSGRTRSSSREGGSDRRRRSSSDAETVLSRRSSRGGTEEVQPVISKTRRNSGERESSGNSRTKPSSRRSRSLMGTGMERSGSNRHRFSSRRRHRSDMNVGSRGATLKDGTAMVPIYRHAELEDSEAENANAKYIPWYCEGQSDREEDAGDSLKCLYIAASGRTRCSHSRCVSRRRRRKRLIRRGRNISFHPRFIWTESDFNSGRRY